MRNIIRKAGRVLKAVWDFWEIYLPAAMFFVLFAVFVFQVFMRYVLRDPVQWSFEVTLFIYIYIILIGSANAERCDEHVVFSMVYDACGPRTKLWMRIISGVLIITIFGIGMPSMIDYAWFIKSAQIKTSTVLKIPYRLLFMCMIYMLWSVMLQRLVGIIRDIRLLVKMKRGMSAPSMEEGGDAP